MPVNALANGRWLGMPCGHRLLLPVRRAVLTRVMFIVNPKSEWERSHSQQGLHGVTAVVEQAEASSSILEYPPENLGESFQAVFSGIDPDDTRKAQCFPINKALFLSQHEFLQRHSVPNAAARFNAKEVATWTDGVTPPVLQRSFVDAPCNEEDDEFTEHPSSTKYRGPVDSTAAVRELGEHKEDVPWSFLCPDAADQELDETAAWQIAQRKLEMIQEQALAFHRQIRQKAPAQHMCRVPRSSAQIDQRFIPAESGTSFANRSQGIEHDSHRRNIAAWPRLGSHRRNAAAWRRLGSRDSGR